MRIQVNLSEDMVKKVDNYAQMMGVSRSSLCSMFVGQSVMGFDKTFDIFSSMAGTLVKNELKDDLSGQMSIEDVMENSSNKATGRSKKTKNKDV